jgi:hypothetical protein
VLQQAFGVKPVLLACERDGELQGVLPVAETAGLFSGRLLCSLPHTPVAGPVANSAETSSALVKAAIERAQSVPGMRLQLRPSSPLNQAPGLVSRPALATYIRELPEAPEALHFGGARNHSRIRWALNHAVHAGVAVREAETRDELRAWYRLYLNTMRWHTSPPMPFVFFEAIWELLKPRGFARLLLAEQTSGRHARLICGSLYLMFARTVFWAKTGWRREDSHLHPHEVIHWHAMREASAAHYRWYDFGEAQDDNKGQEQFKTKWSCEGKRLYRYYYPEPHDTKRRLTTLQRSSMYQLASEVWQRIPLRATELAGTFLYRYF